MIAHVLRSGPNQEQWTSAHIKDQLLIDLCEKEQTLSADIVKELSREIFDSSRGISVLKYRAEFLRTAHRISASDYAFCPTFRIDPRDPSPRVLNVLAVDRKTQNMIMMDAIKRILRSNNNYYIWSIFSPIQDIFRGSGRNSILTAGFLWLAIIKVYPILRIRMMR